MVTSLASSLNRYIVLLESSVTVRFSDFCSLFRSCRVRSATGHSTTAACPPRLFRIHFLSRLLSSVTFVPPHLICGRTVFTMTARATRRNREASTDFFIKLRGHDVFVDLPDDEGGGGGGERTLYTILPLWRRPIISARIARRICFRHGASAR